MSSLPDRPRLQPAAPVPVRQGAVPAGGRRHTPFDVPARAATVMTEAAVAFTIAVVPLLAAVTVPHVLVVGWLDRRAALSG